MNCTLLQTVVRQAEAHAAISSLVGGPLARFHDPTGPHCRHDYDRTGITMVAGRCRKQAEQIAAHLRISSYTVNQYTKTIHRHFGVTTRAELLARWVRRGWGGEIRLGREPRRVTAGPWLREEFAGTPLEGDPSFSQNIDDRPR